MPLATGKRPQKAAAEYPKYVSDRCAGRTAVLRAKKGVHDLVHMGSWSNKSGLDEMMDFYDDMLWQSFYAASLSPSYLNRQPYGFLVQDHSIYLVQQEDAYTDNLDAALDLGIVMLHFSAVASQWAGQVHWNFHLLRPTACRKDFAPLRCTTCNDSGGSKATVKCATADPRLSVCFIRKEEPISQSLSKENRRLTIKSQAPK